MANSVLLDDRHADQQVDGQQTFSAAAASTEESSTPLASADLHDLMSFYWGFQHSYTLHWNPFGKADPKLQQIQTRIEQLYSRDYEICAVPNADYCSTYPINVIVPVREKSSLRNSKSDTMVNDPAVLATLFRKSRFARVRSRFVVPAILYRQRNICRSSTLSNEAEVLLNTFNEKTRQFLWSGTGTETTSSVGDDNTKNAAQQTTVDKQRAADITLLKELKVGLVADLMVEQRKVKYGLTVTSSEKADSQQRYTRAGVEIASVPYPGVEFFRMFKANNYCGRNLHFDWAQPFADAELSVPDIFMPPLLSPQDNHTTNDTCNNSALISNISWNQYKSWDLIRLTQNYLRLFLRVLTSDSSSISDNQERNNSPGTGLLVHCISGWDRTPAFISWLRLSLWADGAIHETLSPLEILYFTIGYDWLLFSHLLADRTQRGEDIFCFCFYFLMHMLDDSFSVSSNNQQRQNSQESATQLKKGFVPEHDLTHYTSSTTPTVHNNNSNSNSDNNVHKQEESNAILSTLDVPHAFPDTTTTTITKTIPVETPSLIDGSFSSISSAIDLSVCEISVENNYRPASTTTTTTTTTTETAAGTQPMDIPIITPRRLKRRPSLIKGNSIYSSIDEGVTSTTNIDTKSTVATSTTTTATTHSIASKTPDMISQPVSSLPNTPSLSYTQHQAEQQRQQPLPGPQSSSWQFVSLLQGGNDSTKPILPLSQARSSPLSRPETSPIVVSYVATLSATVQPSPTFHPAVASLEASTSPPSTFALDDTFVSPYPSMRRRYSSHDDFMYIQGTFDEEEFERSSPSGNSYGSGTTTGNHTTQGLGMHWRRDDIDDNSSSGNDGRSNTNVKPTLSTKRRQRQVHSDSEDGHTVLRRTDSFEYIAATTTATMTTSFPTVHNSSRDFQYAGGVRDKLQDDIFALAFSGCSCCSADTGIRSIALPSAHKVNNNDDSNNVDTTVSTSITLNDIMLDGSLCIIDPQADLLPSTPVVVESPAVPAPVSESELSPRAIKLLAVRRLFIEMYLQIFRHQPSPSSSVPLIREPNHTPPTHLSNPSTPRVPHRRTQSKNQGQMSSETTPTSLIITTMTTGSSQNGQSATAFSSHSPRDHLSDGSSRASQFSIQQPPPSSALVPPPSITSGTSTATTPTTTRSTSSAPFITSTPTVMMEAAKSSLTNGLKNLSYMMMGMSMNGNSSSPTSSPSQLLPHLSPLLSGSSMPGVIEGSKYRMPSVSPFHQRRQHPPIPPVSNNVDTFNSSWQRRSNYFG